MCMCVCVCISENDGGLEKRILQIYICECMCDVRFFFRDLNNNA
jgi:hypothetical protein